jgi:hypothetical protein
MFPHERSLVKRLESKPFALIGINSDNDLAECRRKNIAEQITWRSFWNGDKGTGGLISKTWEVSGWPTLYLIDHQGVIRRKFVGSPNNDDLDRLIDELVEKAEKQR